MDGDQSGGRVMAEAALPEDVKKRALVLILAALGMTALIGAALPRLQFQPGMPLPSFENGQLVARSGDAEPFVGVPVSDFVRILVYILTCAALLYILYRITRGVNWRQALKDALSFLAVLLVLLGALVLILTLLPKGEGVVPSAPLPMPEPAARAPLGPVPPLLIWLAGLGLLIAAIVTGVWVVRSKPGSEADLWQIEVENARDSLLAGGDLREVIVRCYQQMSQALAQEQEIERESFMTTGEFERVLTTKGIPYAPVHQLTQLFDAVRYGHWQPNRQDEQRAIQSLDAIVEYSRTAGTEG